LKALVCSPALGAALGLVEDIPLQVADSTANAQVLATHVQDLGLTGRGRKIVVLDTGYNYNHPELASSYLGGTNFVNDTGDPFDNNGHGSHVAGIITGDGIDPRARGIAPETGIIAGKVLDANGFGYTSDLVAGIYWAIDGPDGYFGTADDFHADAINISIGTQGMYPSLFCDAAVPAVTDAIRYARDHGVVVVIAAGNNGASGVSLPGCVSYSVTVGAIDRSNVITSFSGTGPAVDLVAPGVALYSAWLGTSYKSLNGTSQAAPVVSGAIALFREAFPTASVEDLEHALLTSASDLGFLGKDNRYGWGQFQASPSLGVLTASLANTSLSCTRSNDQLIISWPANPPGFLLQASQQMAGVALDWHTVTNAIVRIENQNTATFLMPPTNQFFRLWWPQ
jgi:subtilisin family serine protease